MQTSLCLKTLYTNYATGRGISYICLSLCEHMRGDGLDVRAMFPASDPDGRRPFSRDAVAPWLRRVAYRADPSGRHINSYAERRFISSLCPEDVVYLWPAVSLATYREIKARGHRIIMERINCHRATSMAILDEAYRRLGWPPSHDIRLEDVATEQEKLSLADYVFSPSPMVAASLRAAGLSVDVILPTSFGWAPERLAGTRIALPPCDGITVLFVGLFCVRKGAPLLLDAWARSGLKGRLVILGAIEPDVAARCADALSRPDVVHVPYCNDVGPFYRSADIFAFPSLEEGGPLVTYEAMASGLPVLVSPMGAGAVARDGLDGLILQPQDREAWIASLRRLAADPDLREHFGRHGRERAMHFTWQQVGARRREQLRTVLALAPRGQTAGVCLTKV